MATVAELLCEIEDAIDVDEGGEIDADAIQESIDSIRAELGIEVEEDDEEEIEV